MQCQVSSHTAEMELEVPLSSWSCWLHCFLIHFIAFLWLNAPFFFSPSLSFFWLRDSRLHRPAPCGKCQPHRACSQPASVQPPVPVVPSLRPEDGAQEHCQDDLLEQIWREDSIRKRNSGFKMTILCRSAVCIMHLHFLSALYGSKTLQKYSSVVISLEN